MLLLYQVGSVKIGEVVRYTVTYTPSQDRILPSPHRLYLRVRNTSAIALRAAFVHGPYTLSAAAYPASYNPNEKFINARRLGVPEFEPMIKAGGSWECELVVPEDIRQSAGAGNGAFFGKGPEHDAESASWVIEVSSQVLFSTSAAVGYEVCVARDQKSLNLSYTMPVIGSQVQAPQPGKVSDHQQSAGSKDRHPAQPKGVFSKAIKVVVEDTATLWNTPRLPGWDDVERARVKPRNRADAPVENTPEPSAASAPTPPTDASKPKKIHLVVLTHGLHSNLGADMLYMKESIDAAVKQAKIDAKVRKAKEREAKKPSQSKQSSPPSPTPCSPTEDVVKGEGESDVVNEEEEEEGEDTEIENEVETKDNEKCDDDDDDEEVIVRGYSGNATRTERGIKFLGKRLARYILSMAYPDQPYLPTFTRSATENLVSSLKGDGSIDPKPAHKHSSIVKDPVDDTNRPFKITSISFIGHSLGGIVQTYAVAYIQKHSPNFFDTIKPINFIALATPFLGLNHENPLYIKFALDFGLVGRTGQDLGLTWRAPTIARSSWGALVSNLGESAHKKMVGDGQTESKPLLRILPTGPAHTALKKFRNRTVYSNVVNDGIVPLRTSCLLFLDWQGLGRVEKARREAGLVETVVGFGWAELTGTNLTTPRRSQLIPVDSESAGGSGSSTPPGHDSHEVPQPSIYATLEDDTRSLRSFTISTPETEAGASGINGPFSGFFSLFRRDEPPKSPTQSAKQNKIYRRSQTIKFDEESTTTPSSQTSRVTSGHEFEDDIDGLSAPPRTTLFESAGDLLNPKVPGLEYLLDPSKRPRTIFHDRVYHPSDIPGLPLKKRPSSPLNIRRKTFTRTASSGSTQMSLISSDSDPYSSQGINHEDTMNSTKDYDDTANTNPNRAADEEVDSANLRVEEKIARAYHRGLSWRKVLVKLEPDAHNNIIVRRMFANSYGWPVVKHLVDAHFSDSATARTRDDDEGDAERALNMGQSPTEQGAETKSSEKLKVPRLESQEAEDNAEVEAAREALDTVPDLPTTPRIEVHDTFATVGQSPDQHLNRPHRERMDSMTWSDRDWQDSEFESDLELDPYAHDGRPALLATQATEKQQKESTKGEEIQRSTSPLAAMGWNWAEKIVGKGSTNRAKSPQSSDRKESD
jgi:hypothetical protein